MSWGVACHLIFGLAVAAMIAGMWLGMQAGLGVVPQPWAWAVNLLLLLQFPLGHSILLSAPGRRVLSRLAPAGRGPVLATTTYALIASLQLLSIFALWTPSGIVWWQAEGWVLWAITGLYAGAWLLLMKASWDAGAEVQSGLLGWVSLLRGVTPRFPPMPVTGLFRLIRQPIYVSFALTTWLVPVWTPDQLLTASVLTAYCALGPLLKERRFDRLFGAEWRAYRAVTPYWIPRRTRPRGANQDGSRGADLAGAVRPR
ncbi:MAG: isoprenylcysteine carboxylmethyltransferase family protein [Pseudomonadota bacterium]